MFRSGAAIWHSKQPALDLAVKKFGQEGATAAGAELPESLSDLRDTRHFCDDETMQAQTGRGCHDSKIAGADLLKHLIRRARCEFFRGQPLKDRFASVARDCFKEPLFAPKEGIERLPRTS